MHPNHLHTIGMVTSQVTITKPKKSLKIDCFQYKPETASDIPAALTLAQQSPAL